MKLDGLTVPGILLSLLANGIFFVCNPLKEIGVWQFIICSLLPLVIFLPLFIIVCFSKLLFHGNLTLAQWGEEEAKKIISSDEKSFKKLMSRLFLIAYQPFIFISSWLIGSFIFYSFIKKYQ
jgi:hypothetical protein